MKVIKRNGSEVNFDVNKIVAAIAKANKAAHREELTREQIQEIAEYINFKCTRMNRAISVEEMQDMVENQIMAQGAFNVARCYVRYRYTRSLVRKSNTTDDRILSLIECNNEEVLQENSNKDPIINSVQRDYMAGEVSKDLTRRLLLPTEIVKADQEGLIHFHDSDYFAQHMHNCDLVNLEDMLQNGTVISETFIDKPQSFSTACNIAMQITAQVASNQYGGQSISLTHLVPFVQVSREKIRKEVLEDARMMGNSPSEEVVSHIVERRLRKEVEKGVQLYGGYSTISLGYAGLCECVKYMTGKSHTDPEAKPFALDVMKHMNEACNRWKEETNIAFSIYGSPIESTTYKFAKCLQRRFGIVEGVTDKGYITNSYHVKVTEPIDAFAKLKFEADFQALSTGGAISYVEVPNMQNNIPAVLAVIKFIYDNIMYAELNTKSDFCQACGYSGEIQIVEEDGKLVWECPSCGNRDQNTLNVARRTCGYIGTQFWNQGRTQEIKERVMHL